MRGRRLICLCAGVVGSTGDVRPLIALGLALRARGFDIFVLGDEAFEPSALRAGILPSEWVTCSGMSQTQWLRSPLGQRRLWGGRPRSRDRALQREIARVRLERMERFWRRIDGPDNPRIVAAVASITGLGTLLTFGPQCAKIVSCPMPSQPSRFFTMVPPDLSLLERLQDWTRRRAARAERRRFCEDLYHLVSASPSVFPRPPDWLPNMQVTGYVPLEEDHRDWSPPAPLREFLAVDPPPAYVGFGSHAVLFGPEGLARAEAIVEGCRRRHVRCVLHGPDVSRSLASDDVFVVDHHVPHAWLFPRCAVIVHHGGYGTMHAALIARRPMIIYPFQTDQFLWAARMGELGIGPGFTARLRHLSAARLAADLARVLRPECARNAARLGDALSTERGLTVQVTAIESIVEHARCGRRPVEWQMPIVA